MIVDESTHLKFSNFYQTKNGMIEPSCVLISNLCNQSIVTKYVRLDNAGEKKASKNTPTEISGNLT